jgi:hypothetical protein
LQFDSSMDSTMLNKQAFLRKEIIE